MTCLRALRDAAMVEVKPQKRQLLINAADYLQTCTEEFCKEQTTTALTSLNGAWAHAARALAIATPPVDPTPPLAPAVKQRRVA